MAGDLAPEDDDRDDGRLDTAFAELIGTWPTGAEGDLRLARRLFDELGPEDRRKAIDYAGHHLTAQRRRGRSYVQAVATYLRNAPWRYRPTGAAPQGKEPQVFVRVDDPLWPALAKANGRPPPAVDSKREGGHGWWFAKSMVDRAERTSGADPPGERAAE